jgi:hypothetical protein
MYEAVDVYPRILDLGISWWCLVSFRPWQQYPRGKCPRYALDVRLGGPQSQPRSCKEEKSFSYPDSNFDLSAFQVVASRHTDWAILAPDSVDRLTKSQKSRWAAYKWGHAGQLWLNYPAIFVYAETKIKVVPLLNELCTTPWRRMEEWMYRSTFSWPRCKLDVSGQFHVPVALAPGKEILVPTWWEAGRTQEQVRTIPRSENSWLYRDWNSDPSFVQLVVSRYTDYAITDH